MFKWCGPPGSQRRVACRISRVGASQQVLVPHPLQGGRPAARERGFLPGDCPLRHLRSVRRSPGEIKRGGRRPSPPCESGASRTGPPHMLPKPALVARQSAVSDAPDSALTASFPTGARRLWRGARAPWSFQSSYTLHITRASRRDFCRRRVPPPNARRLLSNCICISPRRSDLLDSAGHRLRPQRGRGRVFPNDRARSPCRLPWC